MLGIQPRPTQIEALGWLVYVLVGMPFVFWPRWAAAGRQPQQSAVVSGRA